MNIKNDTNDRKDLKNITNKYREINKDVFNILFRKCEILIFSRKII